MVSVRVFVLRVVAVRESVVVVVVDLMPYVESELECIVLLLCGKKFLNSSLSLASWYSSTFMASSTICIQSDSVSYDAFNCCSKVQNLKRY